MVSSCMFLDILVIVPSLAKVNYLVIVLVTLNVNKAILKCI